MADPAEKPLRLDERLALRPKEAATAIGLSERAFRAILPELPHVRVGGAVLVPIESLREWLRRRSQAAASRVDGAVEKILSDIVNK
jgi:hypothetical protein